LLAGLGNYSNSNPLAGLDLSAFLGGGNDNLLSGMPSIPSYNDPNAQGNNG
jgi:hypothetical protein